MGSLLVLGHEITHVANGDMVTLALIQGVVDTFVIFLSRAIGSVSDAVPARFAGRAPRAWAVLFSDRHRAAGRAGHSRQHRRHVVLVPADKPLQPCALRT